jgi:hypothetical protein
MLPGRYLFVFMVMIWGTNSVPAHADSSYNRQDCLLAGGTQSKDRRHHRVDQ